MPYPSSAGADGICVQSIAGNFGKPRMMAVEKVEGRTAILVVDAVESTVVHLMDVNGDGKIEGADERKVLVQTDRNDVVKKLSHGIAIVGDYVFATSAHQLYRWEYNRGARELSNQVTLVDGISDHPLSEGGSEETKWGHVTRTLAVNADTMFISVGSAFNVDANEFRSALRKVPLATLLQPASTFATPLQFIDLALVANGLRNEVGLAFDSDGVLWGVENGADNAYHKELGGDVHNDNPSEEVNKFDITKERLFYGYPYCWSEFRLPDAARATYGHQPGRQWVWERTLGSADAGFADTHNDTFCRDTSKVVAPHYSFQAHMAPLGITFLKDECELSPDAFPCAWKGKAFVAFHGSWNRNPAVGYKVVMLDMEAKTEVDIFTSATAASGGAAPFVQGTRPVDVQFDPVSGVMYLTQDGIRGQGEVLVIRYIGDALTVVPATPSPPTNAPPTPAPETVAPPTIAPPTAVPTPAVPFFNGVDFDGLGFSIQNNNKGITAASFWSIPSNGVIFGDGNKIGGTPQSGLYSLADYGSYDLTFEYQYTETVNWGNSGVWIHGGRDFVDSDGAFPASIEMQLRKGYEGDLLVKQLWIRPEPGFPTNWDQSTRNGRILRRQNPQASLYGSWNKVRIVTQVTPDQGSVISVWINDVFVNKGINCDRSAGRITFQAEGSDIMFGNIVMKSID